MTRLGALFAVLAACAADSPPVDDVAHFQGVVGQSVSHVMAVSPVVGSLSKVVAPVVDGSFSIDTEPNRPWALVFVDASQRGADMVRGILRADTLDTFVPVTGGVVDLGQISIDNHEATMAGSSEGLDRELGVSHGTLATIGGIDDIALRYANPDIDADGLLDVEQGVVARLEMHAEYAIRASGRDAAVVDFINNAEAITYAHTGTGIYGRLPESFGSVDRDDSDVTFEQPFHGYWAGAQTPPVAAGQPITQLTYGDGRTHTEGGFAS